MFICQECKETKMDYAVGLMHSDGPCELCGRIRRCLDAHDYKMKGAGSTSKAYPRRMMTSTHEGALDAVSDLVDEIAKLQRNLASRDKFIVERGLWDDFVDQLPREPS
jgi:hypothetical protein